MIEYQKVYKCLGLKDEIIQIALGNLEFPRGTYSQPALCYGFPPIMIPFWSSPDAMIYTGICKHWFSTRSLYFSRMHLNIEYRVDEIAKTVSQFSQYIIAQEIVFEDDLSKKISLFAKEIGVSNLKELNLLTLKSGDDPTALLNLSEFKQNAPLFCFKDSVGYQGDFPNEGMQLTENIMHNTCSLELDDELEKKFIGSPNCPAWFKAKNKKDLFYQYLSNEEYSNAWFTLNSHGWLFSDVKNALQALGRAVNDTKFHTLVNAWCSLNHERFKDGY